MGIAVWLFLGEVDTLLFGVVGLFSFSFGIEVVELFFGVVAYLFIGEVGYLFLGDVGILPRGVVGYLFLGV